MNDTRSLEVRLPADLPNTTYAAIAQAFWAVLNTAGLGETSTIRSDAEVTDAELTRAFDKDWQSYPWGP